MSMMSRQMNIPAMQRILMEFEKESSMMDMKEEMMSDAVDDVMDVSFFSLPRTYVLLKECWMEGRWGGGNRRGRGG